MIDLTLAICLFNKENYIRDTLESICHQSFTNYHLIIIDDCSTDNSVEIVQNYFNEKERPYELIKFEENKGIGYARHYAEMHATTKYMMFVDSDDLLYPQAIEMMYNKIKADNDLMAVGCYLEYIDSKGEKIGGGLFLGETTKEGFYEKAEKKKLIFMQPTAIYDRETALSVGGYNIDGFPEGKPRYQDYCEDLDLWTRMSDLYVQKKAIIVIPEVLCQYRKAGGLSASSFNMVLKMRYVKKNLLLRRSGKKDLTFIEFMNQLPESELKDIHKDADAADFLRNGVFYIREHQWWKGLSLVTKSIWLKPSYIGDKLKHNLLKKWRI